MIKYITPWTSDKNLSGFYNRETLALPNDNDWVCFTDRDTWFPHPFYGRHIEEVIEKHGEDYRLMTCMTNRVGQGYQCVPGMWNIENGKSHEDISKELWEKNKAEVINISDKPPFSGVLILVQKKFITENRLLKEGLLLGADNQMAYIANEHFENVGLMTGIYVWHYYRGGDQSNKSHLL